MSNDKDGKLKKTIDKIKSIKHIEIILAVIAVAVMIIIYFTTLGAGQTDSKKPPVTKQDYCTQMKIDITEAVKKMCGGDPTVVINWESSVESVIAYITNVSNGTSTSTPQIITTQGTSSPIILKEIYPKALGVIIICQGGSDVKTKLSIISAISILLDITPEKICVLPTLK